jgi:hypothetical protein
MFISFLLPYIDRGQGPIFRFIMASQAASFRLEELALIADNRYFSEQQPWGREENRFAVKFQNRDESEWQRIRKFSIASEVFNELDARSHSMLDAFRILLTQDYPPLRQALSKIFSEICREERPEAVLSWCTLPSLQLAASEFDLPVIHNELGPFRSPCYQETIYFDFKGVNGRTSAAEDIAAFLDQTRNNKFFNPLSLDEIRQILIVDPGRVHNGANPEFRHGAALQVEDDSNMIAFNKGMTNFELIFTARKGITPRELLIRRHPKGFLDYSPRLGTIDNSRDSIEFISRCEEIFCTNSSIVFEALLMGKPVRVLGDSPAAEFSREKRERYSERDYLICLNYLFLGYLAPLSMIFNSDYYRWRLSKPSFLDIYDRHLSIFRSIRDNLPALPQSGFPSFHISSRAMTSW